MAKFIKFLIYVLVITISGFTSYSQDTYANRYKIENVILGYYYTQLRSEQGSLASIEQQKEFQRRKFHEQDIKRLEDPFSIGFIYNIKYYNKKFNRPLDDYSIMWGDMTDAKYFTLHFDKIEFSYPHMAKVWAHIDYGNRIVKQIYAVRRWNDIWWIYDIAISFKPLIFLDQYIIENY